MKNIGYMTLILFNLFLATAYTAPVLSIPEKEILIYKVIPKHGEAYSSKTIYTSESKDNILFYSYVHLDKKVTFDVRTHRNGIPERIIWNNADTNASFSFDGTGVVKLLLHDKEGLTEKSDKFMPNVSVENALIARTLDLDSKDKYEFDLIQCDKLPELTAYRMFFQVMEEETVKVEAGTFNCKKVLFSRSGWTGMFYKAYYYISNDEHRYLIKMENMPEGGASELIKIQ
jgi:hypothetical protein